MARNGRAPIHRSAELSLKRTAAPVYASISFGFVLPVRRGFGFEDPRPGALEQQLRHRQVVAPQARRRLPLFAFTIDALQRNLVEDALVGLIREHSGLHAAQP